MSNGDGRPSFLRTPTLNTPQCTNTSGSRCRGRPRPEASARDRPGSSSGASPERSRGRACVRWPARVPLARPHAGAIGIHHHVAGEPVRKTPHGGDDRLLIARNAGDQRGFRTPYRSNSSSPIGAPVRGILRRQLPSEQRVERFDGKPLLFDASARKNRARKNGRGVRRRPARPRAIPSPAAYSGPSWNGKPRDARRECQLSQSGDVVHAELLHHRLTIASNGLQTQIEHHRDLFAGLAFGHQSQHLQLARRKLVERGRHGLRFQIAALDSMQQPVGNLRAQIRSALGDRSKRFQQVVVGRSSSARMRARRRE